MTWLGEGDPSALHDRFVVALLLVFVAVVWAAWRRLTRLMRAHGRSEAWRNALFGAVALADLVLLNNAVVYAEGALIGWFEGDEPRIGALLVSEASVFLGAASVMWLVVVAASDANVVEREAPDAAAARALQNVLEDLLRHYWLAALGLALLFGAADVGGVLLLAVELTIIWLVGRGLGMFAAGRAAGADRR